jgi:hypothetical protein
MVRRYTVRSSGGPPARQNERRKVTFFLIVRTVMATFRHGAGDRAPLQEIASDQTEFVPMH